MAFRTSLSVIVFSTGQLLSLVAGLALQVLVGRSLLPVEYGYFVVASTVLLALILGLVSAVPKALCRIVSVDAGQLGLAIRTLLLVQLPICCLVALLLVGFARLEIVHSADGILSLSLQLVAIELIIRGGLLEPAWALLNGLRYHRTQATLMLLHSMLRLACVAIYLTYNNHISGCLLALATASLVSLSVVSVVLCHAYFHTRDILEQPGNKVTNWQLTRWMRWAPAAELLNYLIVASNLWFLRWISEDSVAIGLYAACFMLAQAFLPLGVAVSRGLFATFANIFHEQKLQTGALLLRAVLRCLIVITAPAIAVAFLYGNAVVLLFFGHDYQNSGAMLGMVTSGTMGVALVWVLGDILNAAERLGTRLLYMLFLALFAQG